MKRRIRKILFSFIRPFLRAFFSLFFEKKYLKGRYFDESLVGWGWAMRSLIIQKIFRINHNVKWPISPSMRIDEPENIAFDPDDMQNFMHIGCYFSNVGGGKIEIGKGTVIAPNVGIITTNHNINDISEHQHPKDVKIGKNCWLGMNCLILPGVELGDNTVVAGGAIVTKSFKDGYCVLVGAPAVKKKDII